jgi:DNA-binding HxlR family transcriptional regulator
MTTRTAAQRKLDAKLAYDAFLAGCPSRQLLDRLSDKWVTLVMAALAGGPARYSELARHIAGVSQKMLSQTLRELERDGLITRTVTPSVPIRVDYELTELGRSLLVVVEALKAWAERHMDQILEARETFDSAALSA